MDIKEVSQRLEQLSDGKNAKRSSTIIPNSKPNTGVRVPNLRKLAKEIAKEDYKGFLENCPDDTFEQQMLQAFVIGYAKDDIETILFYGDGFIPKIQDWCVNDAFCQTFSIARKHREVVWNWLMKLADVEKEYYNRVVAVTLLSHFLVDEHIEEVFEVMNRLDFDSYYTQMGVAWCVATAYAKYPQKGMQFLKSNQLSDFTYDKSIQKMIESFRVTSGDKEVLRQMKRGKNR